jgi:hypothetical protein
MRDIAFLCTEMSQPLFET